MDFRLTAVRCRLNAWHLARPLVGYEPTHSTFHRALTRLQDEDSVAIEDYSDGAAHTTYRKLPAPPRT